MISAGERVAEWEASAFRIGTSSSAQMGVRVATQNGSAVNVRSDLRWHRLMLSRMENDSHETFCLHERCCSPL